MSQSLHSKLPDRLVTIAVRDDQEDATCGLDQLARQVQEAVAERLEGHPLITGGEHQPFAPRQQIERQLPNQERGPVGRELLGRELRQAKAAL